MANSASYNQIRKPSINTGFFKDRHKDMMLALARMMMVPCPIKTDTNAQIKSFLGIYGRNDATWKLHAAYIGASATDYDSYWISAQIYRMKKMGYYVRSEPTTLENIQMVCQAVGSGLYGLALIVGGDIIIATTGYTGIGLGFGVYATTSGLSRVAGSFSDLNAIYDRNYENIGKGDILNNLAYGVGYHLNGKDGANFLTGVRNMTDGGIYLYSMNVATNQNIPSRPGTSANTYKGATKNIFDLEESIQDVYSEYSKSGWKGLYSGAPSGMKAGGSYENNGTQNSMILPNGSTISYRKFDIFPPTMTGRDGYRFVVDNQYNIYYTDNHYVNFVRIVGF